jgi:SAM-dependent methyltransferase
VTDCPRGRSRWLNEAAVTGGQYDQAWARLEARGENPHGEADFIASLDVTSVLDAGCGTGRVAIELARRGYAVVGVDLDPRMLETARQKGPRLRWERADLAELDLDDGDGSGLRSFDAVVMAGNVMIFVEPGTEPAVIARLAAHLAPNGLLVAGFQLRSGGLTLEAYDLMASAAGLRLLERHATWSREPFEAPGDYAVSVHVRS